MGAEVVGPQQDGEDGFPETQLEKADGEQPSGTPNAAHEGVLVDADSSFH